jgi:hypothetical protein
VVVDEVGATRSLPTVDVDKKFSSMALVGDEVPVEKGWVVPVSISIEGESSEDLEVSFAKSRVNLDFPVLRHAR